MLNAAGDLYTTLTYDYKYSIASVSSSAGKSVSEKPISNSILNKKNFNKMLSSTDHR